LQQHDLDATGGRLSGVAATPAGAADCRYVAGMGVRPSWGRGGDVTGAREFGN
jgi:hypothetical protein